MLSDERRDELSSRLATATSGAPQTIDIEALALLVLKADRYRAEGRADMELQRLTKTAKGVLRLARRAQSAPGAIGAEETAEMANTWSTKLRAARRASLKVALDHATRSRILASHGESDDSQRKHERKPPKPRKLPRLTGATGD